MNGRGLPERDDLVAGSVSLSRQYQHSAARFLTRSDDAGRTYQYRFDATGLPTWIEEGQVSREISASGGSLVAGDLTYDLDALGRTIRRGDLTLAYGADGQLSRAERGGRIWTFLHDEAGQRLAKIENGTPGAAFLAEGYLDGVQLVQPVKVGGRTVGVLRNGAFESVATDVRGTVLAEADGTPRVASPFGGRDVRPAMAAALDYVEKAFDADLGLVRMGVRDYDPQINRFTTPDPLFLETPSECVGSPKECNLYAYARGSPTVFDDPSGMGTTEHRTHRNATLAQTIKVGATTGQKVYDAVTSALRHEILAHSPVQSVGTSTGLAAEAGMPFAGGSAQYSVAVVYYLDSGKWSMLITEGAFAGGMLNGTGAPERPRYDTGALNMAWGMNVAASANIVASNARTDAELAGRSHQTNLSGGPYTASLGWAGPQFPTDGIYTFTQGLSWGPVPSGCVSTYPVRTTVVPGEAVSRLRETLWNALGNVIGQELTGSAGPDKGPGDERR
jgi:RHS repeat-associated protein